ncbi:MAG: ABC transporter ATP-binding protein, partial [Desulfobacteraceae bacterium]
AALALAISSYGYIMENGKVVIDGTAGDLVKNEDVQEFYLGASGDDGENRSYKDIKHYKKRKRWLS